ncbi:Signal transduction histidine kinase [Modicisalibacter ilicicola DSM 19980]|uniref:histidine kinase n=1 Tax=Modicisalibacter ilicicola DSM 19980 TaxID=1121942 RepID=A0A1M4WBB2_9GAMM|nr:ATP-binding protein [Halomonas ilicicola]SHE78548.1 Signal transduction histidine kinase [Halomonas ilicicola DSM 19980]
MSLRNRLLLTLGLTLTLLWGLAAAWLMRDLHEELQSTLDQRLAQSARMAAGLVGTLPENAWKRAERPRLSIPAIAGLACQVRSPGGKVIARTHGDLDDVLAPQASGHSYRQVDGEYWRVFTYRQDGLTITTADRVNERDRLLRDVLLVTVVPFLVALVGSLVVLWAGIRRGLRPLSRLQRSLAQRQPNALAPVATQGLTAELRPLVDTLNALLLRIQRALAREQRFTNDAAHELRTPLTAIKTHLQIARRREGEAARQAQTSAEEGVARLQNTLEQLLMLARLEGDHEDQPPGDSLSDAVVEDALAALGPDARDTFLIDQPEQGIRLAAPHELVVTALRNLLENARRFSPARGSVRLILEQGDAGLDFMVSDRGPGVDDASLARLTERFWRHGAGRGSGLGLAIVATLAERFGGHLMVDHNRPHGLTVTLRLPKAVPG